MTTGTFREEPATPGLLGKTRDTSMKSNALEMTYPDVTVPAMESEPSTLSESR